MEKNINILIVDDDSSIIENLKDILEDDGYKITGAESVNEAKTLLSKKFYNVSLIDIKLPDGTGLDLLKEIKNSKNETMPIVSTGFASMESAISAMNQGAFAYIQKPVNIDELKLTIKKALKMQSLSFDNRDLLSKLKVLSTKDPMTGLFNYRYLTERLAVEFKRAKRYLLPLSIIMVDIDYFKSVNDIYGHQFGDAILKEMGAFLQTSVRNTDLIARYGGEEFLILMSDTDKNGAIIFGKTLLDSINSHIFDEKNNKLKIKASIGISCFPDAEVNSESDLLNAVDKAMRDAKELGGNKLVVFKGKGIRQEDTIIDKGGKDTVDKLKQKLAKMGNRVNRTLLESIYAFAKTIKAKDHYTGEHTDKMTNIVSQICRILDLSPTETEDIEKAAILHDLGKIGIPDNILLKKGKLSIAEFDLLKTHPQIGTEIIRNIHFLNRVALIVLYHHERFDGTGYSSGLAGSEIPIGARIVSVADVFQALISDRPYRKAYSEQEALDIVQKGSGTQFDPNVVNALSKIC